MRTACLTRHKSQVGVALKHLPATEADTPFRDDTVPWQRVINSKGTISPRFFKPINSDAYRSLTQRRGNGAANRQATELEAEGVEVERGSLGEYSIDFSRFGWFPDSLD